MTNPTNIWLVRLRRVPIRNVTNGKIRLISLWRVEVSLEVDPSSPDGVCVVKINGPPDLTTFRTINRGMRLFRMPGCPSDIRMVSHAHGRPDRPWTARKDLNFRAVRICGSPTGWSGRLGPFT
jgi:hypothetical protein